MKVVETDIYRDIKSGRLYQLRGMAVIESTLDPGIVYECTETGMHWVGPAKEFFDGRFELVLSKDNPTEQ